jgi:hypothetical protein
MFRKSAVKPETAAPLSKKEEPAMQQPAKEQPAEPATARQTPTFRYIDRPDCPEAFADSINSVFFDGQTMRIEFGITRMDEVKQNAPLTGRRYPAVRLVLPPAAAIELINRMQQTGAALSQAGLVKTRPNPGQEAGKEAGNGGQKK